MLDSVQSSDSRSMCRGTEGYREIFLGGRQNSREKIALTSLSLLLLLLHKLAIEFPTQLLFIKFV